MNVLYIIGAICGCLTAIGGVFWGIWAFIRKVVHIVDALEKIREPVQELKHNGGSSIKDKVDESYDLLTDLVKRVKQLEEFHNEDR